MILIPLALVATASAPAAPLAPASIIAAARVAAPAAKLADLIAWLDAPLPTSPSGPNLVCGAADASGDVACRVAKHYGAYVIDTPPRLASGLRLKSVTLRARGDRVRAVSFETSVNEFYRVLVVLRARFGAEAPIVRHDQVKTRRGLRERLVMSWASPEVRVTLTDPTPGMRLSVRIEPNTCKPSPRGSLVIKGPTPILDPHPSAAW